MSQIIRKKGEFPPRIRMLALEAELKGVFLCQLAYILSNERGGYKSFNLGWDKSGIYVELGRLALVNVGHVFIFKRENN